MKPTPGKQLPHCFANVSNHKNDFIYDYNEATLKFQHQISEIENQEMFVNRKTKFCNFSIWMHSSTQWPCAL